MILTSPYKNVSNWKPKSGFLSSYFPVPILAIICNLIDFFINVLVLNNGPNGQETKGPEMVVLSSSLNKQSLCVIFNQ